MTCIRLHDIKLKNVLRDIYVKLRRVQAELQVLFALYWKWALQQATHTRTDKKWNSAIFPKALHLLFSYKKKKKKQFLNMLLHRLQNDSNKRPFKYHRKK